MEGKGLIYRADGASGGLARGGGGEDWRDGWRDWGWGVLWMGRLGWVVDGETGVGCLIGCLFGVGWGLVEKEWSGVDGAVDGDAKGEEQLLVNTSRS